MSEVAAAEEVIDDTVNPEVVDDSSEAEASELSLEQVHSMGDDELNEFLQFADAPVNSDEEDNPAAEEPAAEIVDSTEGEEEGEIDVEAEDPEEEGEESEDDDSEDIGFRGTLDELFMPLKANGREIQIESVEEGRRLMQKGIDYAKNMGEFAPYKKAMSLLKAKNALDPERLNFLLDVEEGKPEAIAKLLKDIEIDPYDIDVQKGEEYESTYEDTEPQEAFQAVIDGLPSGETKIQTLEILASGGWDRVSKEVLFNQPENIKKLNIQIEDGTFDKIMSSLTKKRALGDLVDVTDLEAYNIVGTELTNQGILGVPNNPTDSAKTTPPKKQKKDVKNKRKRAATTPRQAPSNVPTADTFNPATASEAELEEFVQDQLKSEASFL